MATDQWIIETQDWKFALEQNLAHTSQQIFSLHSSGHHCLRRFPWVWEKGEKGEVGGGRGESKGGEEGKRETEGAEGRKRENFEK